MCRLFGLIANKEVDMNYSFFKADEKPFKDLSKLNRDGWGVGWYEKGETKIFKEGLDEAGNIDKYNFAQVSDLLSRIFISHVRYATSVEKTERESHPFSYEDWLFAHNGGVNRSAIAEKLDEGYKKRILGATDSEAYFMLMMQNIEAYADPISGIAQTLEFVKNASNYSGLNFILSDGNIVFAYRGFSSNPSHYSLFYLERDPENPGPEELYSEETQLMMRSKGLKGERAVLICSEKLSREDWAEIPPDNLLKIDDQLSCTLIELS